MKTLVFVLFLSLNGLCYSQQHLPYPIIFIHGLNSDSTTWNDQKIFMEEEWNLNYGGTIHYCLNYDGNNSIANVNVYPETGADIARFIDTSNDLVSGDFYLINFDISNTGITNPNSENDVLSNESAIVKQAIALQKAISIILTITGKDKVILMGHSMGGLAAREYLQNELNWQADANHHVAKLITTGTPHGGYEGIAISSPSDVIDWQSEAYRDLRHSYLVSGNQGAYLFGGIETFSYMDNNAEYNFYNIDVNCNGAVGETIVGLNQKPLVDFVDYSYIVGLCTGCIPQGVYAGDGVVRDYNANFSNFYNFTTPNEYILYGTHPIEIHSDMPKNIVANMQGLDEPNEYWLSYNIDFATAYRGFITSQPTDGYSLDYDDYKFSLTGPAEIEILFSKFTSGNVEIRIVDEEYNIVYTQALEQEFEIISQTLPAGEYILEVASETEENGIFKYEFILQSNLSLDDIETKLVSITPNPTTSTANINSMRQYDNAEIYNVAGQIVLSTKIAESQQFDLSSLEAGLYVVKLYYEENIDVIRIIKQ